jgi:hypothetical protein
VSEKERGRGREREGQTLCCVREERIMCCVREELMKLNSKQTLNPNLNSKQTLNPKADELLFGNMKIDMCRNPKPQPNPQTPT